MSETPRPTLKLKFSAKSATPATPPAQSTVSPTPASASASVEPSQQKLKIKFGRKPQAESPADKEKPKKKKASTKKRSAENVAQPEPAAEGPKRLKLNPSKKPGLQSIRIKNKLTVPTRPVGVGYDSEASDTEADPAIEEQFILRMMPGDDCEYLRQAINERRFDKSEFCFKALTRDGRRAIFKIRQQQYAAAMVDLPCIIEGMKSWDRRGWYKTADISQMLLVLGPVANEEEAMNHPLPPEVQHPDPKTLLYPHGLAPPLRWVRKRRFRERLSARTIEMVEKAVEDLVAQDSNSVFPPRFELVDSASLNRDESCVKTEEFVDDYDAEQDAEGEVMEELMDEFEDDLAAEMEAALAADDQPAATEARGADQTATSSAKPSTPAGPGDSSGDDSDMSDEGGDGEDDLDDEQLEQQRQQQQHREEILELETLIRTETAQWERVTNNILRQKMSRRIQELKKDLELKKVSAGLPGDTDI
ncbi:hypothetical protein N7532_009920 [Penicillium argentinense]|uniref:TAFII55 protein conserved region domain-containing protein n=1 Tax=Penicillium argentinense TaxID=1131581 RepID=A0A9W9ENX5_9EURO|nr:uncharacterized protein N7532_009920 [Penicillium argentinense]KAJ5085149.1 hypothetical protein N7532_009920 [Penicillium argentinense]